MKTTRKIISALMMFIMMMCLCACNSGTDNPTHTPGDTSVNMSDGSTFSVEFFDMGHADAALVECDGNYVLIDGGNKSDSQKMYTILKERNITHLYYVIATGTSDEHVGGLAGALNYATADLVLCPVSEYDSESFKDFSKYTNKVCGGIVEISEGSRYRFGNAEIEFICVDTNNGGNISSILKITYGNTSFVFAGDIESYTETAAVENNMDIKATVLKVAGHGSDNNLSVAFLNQVNPEHIVISTSGLEGCPGSRLMSVLEIASIPVYRTDLHGDIICTSDGTEVTFITEKQRNNENVFKPGKGQPDENDQQTTTPVHTPEDRATPVPTPQSTPETEVNLHFGAHELYRVNQLTNLVNSRDSMKTVDDFGEKTITNSYFRVGNRVASLRTITDNKTGQSSYSGWYKGYNYFHNGERCVQQVFAENLEGDAVIPGQMDLAAYFANEDEVKYIGRDGEDYIFRSDVSSGPYIITIDKRTLAVEKVVIENNPDVYSAEYIYGEQIDGRAILDNWTDGTPLRNVMVYVELFDEGGYTSYEKLFYIPATWELEVDSLSYNVQTFMDEDYSQPYSYPGDDVSYTLYVTNRMN